MSFFRDTMKNFREEARSKKALKIKEKHLFIIEEDESPCYKCYWYLPDNLCWHHHIELSDEEIASYRCNDFEKDTLNE